MKIAAIELKGRKDFSLRLDLAEGREEVSKLVAQPSALNFSFNRRWTQMDADSIAARNARNCCPSPLGPVPLSQLSTINHQLR